MKALNRTKVLLVSLLLICAFALCSAGALLAHAAEYGYTQDDADYYYYSGGNLATAVGFPDSDEKNKNKDYAIGGNSRRGVALVQGISEGEVSFTMTLANAGLSQIFFFGFHSQRLTGGMSSSSPAYHSFYIGAGSGAAMAHFGKYGGTDYSSSIDSTVLGASLRAVPTKVRLVISDSSLAVYFDNENLGGEKKVADIAGIYADYAGAPLYFHMALHARTSYVSTFTDLQIKDADGKIVFRDDFTLLKNDLENSTQTYYRYDAAWQTDLAGGHYTLTAGTLKKHLEMEAPSLGVLYTGESYDFGLNGGYAPAVYGTGSLSVAVKDEEGEIVAPAVSGGTVYSFDAAGAYTAEYTYTDTDDAANFVTAAANFTVAEPYLVLPQVSGEIEPSQTPFDLTPISMNLNPGESLSVTVAPRGGDAQQVDADGQGKYFYTFDAEGVYMVSYTVSGGSGYTDTLEITVREKYTESYLTVKQDASAELTSQLAYVDLKLYGAVTAEIEVSLGNAGGGILNAGFFADKTATSFGSGTKEKVLRIGASKNGLEYVSAGADATTEPIASHYNDGVSENTLFYSKTSFKLELSEDGTLKVYAKLIEEEPFFLGDSETYRALSADYILLYTFHDWADEEFTEGGFYFGFGFTTKNLTDDVTLWRLALSDEDGAILFGDNFYHFTLASTATNGYYQIASPAVRNAVGTRLVRAEGSEWLYPYIDTSSVAASVYVGDAVDLSPKLVNMEEDTEYAVSVANAAGEQIAAGEDGKYTFSEQGRYTVRYTAGDVGRKTYITVKNASTQPTVELDFSAAWREDRIESANAALSEGALTLAGSVDSEAYFVTAGNSELFIFTVKILSAQNGAAVVFGRTASGAYSFSFYEGGVAFTDYTGTRTEFATERDFYGALSEGKYVICRIEVMSGRAVFSAIMEGEPSELIETPLAEVNTVEYVGQVGVTSEGNAVIDDFKFVNLTSVPNDNTVTQAPPEEEDGGGDNGGNDDNNGGGGLPAGAVAGIVIACVAVAGGGVAAVLIVRKKRANK